MSLITTAPTDFSYEALQARYKDGIPLPEDFTWPTHVLDKWASTQPEQRAIHWVSHDCKSERTLSYRQLSDLSHRAAYHFSEIGGIQRGDKVMIQLPRVSEWWICVFGLMRLGAIPVPGTSLLLAKDLEYRASSCKAVGFIGDQSACERFEQISGKVGVKKIWQVLTPEAGRVGKGRIEFLRGVETVPEGEKWQTTGTKKRDLAMLYFTSGTTSLPKLVLLSAEYLMGHVVTGSWYECQPGKTLLTLSDLGWAKAAYMTYGCLNLGATLFVQPPPPGPFSPKWLLTTLNRYPISTLCAPPTIYRTIVTKESLAIMKQLPPKCLKRCVGAGEPLNASVIKEFRDATGLTIKDGWGQTESTPLVANWSGEKVREGSMGKPAPGFIVSIIDAKGNELGHGEEGEMAVRTDTGAGSRWIFDGYLKSDGSIDRREKTCNNKTWYCTGDRGLKDKDGYFWFVGRDDDVITSSGYRIGPFEVESALKAHPAVLESAAVGSPDLARGELVKAFIIPSVDYRQIALSGTKQEKEKLIKEIQDFFKTQTGPYKVPREIEFVEDLPRTVSAKIRRVELRNAEYEKKKDIVKQIKSKL